MNHEANTWTPWELRNLSRMLKSRIRPFAAFAIITCDSTGQPYAIKQISVLPMTTADMTDLSLQTAAACDICSGFA